MQTRLSTVGLISVIAACVPLRAMAGNPNSIVRDHPTVATIHLPQMEESVPEASAIQWNLIGDLQGDAIVTSSDIPQEWQRSTELRRARIGGVVDLFFDWRLRASGDLGRYRGLRDLSLEYRGWPVYIAVGRLIEPFGFLQNGSSGAAFMERPQPSALGPGYGVGLQANYAGESWGITAGAFRATQNSLDLGGRKEKAVTTRVTAALYKSDTDVLHAGLSVSRRNSDVGFLQFDALPESTLVDNIDSQSAVLVADAAKPGTNRYWLYGGELAAHFGPVLVESEYYQTFFDHVRATNPSTGTLENVPSPTFHGYYVESSWLITGERRDYSVRHGTFGNAYPLRPLMNGGAGALEVAARFSHTDLSYYVPFNGPSGDYGHIASAGFNWYPTDAFKVMLDALHIRRDTDDPFGNQSGSGTLYQARAQYYFVLP